MSKVTIGLPCYNEAPFIEETLRSLMAQTEQDLQIIVSDNASTDGTLEIIKSVAATDDRIIVHSSKTNDGGPANFIRVLELAQSPYFMWMGAHDLLAKDYVKKLRLVLDADPSCSLAYANSIFIAKDGSDIRGERVDTGLDLSQDSAAERFKRLCWNLHRCDLFHGLMRRDWVDSAHMTSNRTPDMVLLADLSLRGRFRHIPELMFYRRLNRVGEGEDVWQKRLVEHGYVNASQSMIESWTSSRAAYLALVDAAPLSKNEQRLLRFAVYQSFLERHGVPWDSSQEGASWWDRLLMRLSTDDGVECIRRRIRHRIACQARVDGEYSRARLEWEVTGLLKENQRLRKELTRLKTKKD